MKLVLFGGGAMGRLVSSRAKDDGDEVSLVLTSTDGPELLASAITKTSPAGVTTTAAGTFFGLPIIGFMAQSFTNGTLTSTTGSLIQANYAGTFNHRVSRSITP